MVKLCIIKYFNMKKNLFIIAILFSLTTLTFAQKSEKMDAKFSEAVEKANNYEFIPEIKEGERLMSKGELNAYAVTISGKKRKKVEKAWQKFVKKNCDAKSKYDKKQKIHFTDNAKIKDLSENTVDIYTSFREAGSDIELVAWYDLGGAFLSSESHPQKVVYAELLMEKFAKQMEKEKIEGEIKGEEKKLDKAEGTLKDLVKDKKKLEDDIKKFEKKIEEAKKAVEENIVNQGKAEATIAGQKSVVEAVKSKVSKIE